jgi:putative heme uptake system protein
MRSSSRSPYAASEADREEGTGMAKAERRTVILVDGENIDATLGNTVLKRKPDPSERPRWDRLVDFATRLWGQEVLGLFFLNASSGHLPGPFISALQGVGFRPVPLSGRSDQKVVDIGIQRTLDALVEHPADVLLCSHDGDFVQQMERLVAGEHRVGIVGFPELMSAAYTSLGLHVIDLETEVKAFNQTLPRVRVIPLDEFDPEAFLR